MSLLTMLESIGAPKQQDHLSAAPALVEHSLEKTHLWVSICQCLGQMSPHLSAMPVQPRLAALHHTLPPLLRLAQVACDCRLSPPPASITNATLALLLQWLHAGFSGLPVDEPTLQSLQSDVTLALQEFTKGASGPEAHGLLACCSDIVDGGKMAHTSSAVVRVACTAWRAVPAMGVAQAVQASGGSSLFSLKSALVTLTAILMQQGSPGRSSSTGSTTRRRWLDAIGPDLSDVLAELLALLLNLAAKPSASDEDAAGRDRSSTGAVGVQSQLVVVSTCAAIVRLTTAMVHALGRASVHGAAAVFFAGVQFFHADTSSVTTAGTGMSLLRDASPSVLLLSRHLLQLLQALADGGSSRSSGSSALHIEGLALQLLTNLSGALGADTRLVAELLQDVLLAGTAAARTFWCSQTALRTLLKMPGSANGNANSDETSSSASSSGGSNDVARAIVQRLCQIIAASLSPAVPPQDAQVATDGASTVVEGLSLLRVPWFFYSGTWSTLVSALLSALVNRTHTLHHAQMEELLYAKLVLPLCTASALAALQGAAQRSAEGHLLPPELQATEGACSGSGVLTLFFNCLAFVADQAGCAQTSRTNLVPLASQAMQISIGTGHQAELEKLLRMSVSLMIAEVAKLTYKDS